MFNELQRQIPEGEPDLKIGPLSLWISGYTYINQTDQGHMAYLKTPTLLDTENIIVFSGMSETPVFCIKDFLENLALMYGAISVEQVVEFASNDSEFSVKLTNNNLGQIKVDITYYAWHQSGSLQFESRIDQSYLPRIISDLKKILAKFD
jgi:hypothetical protein